MAGMKFEYDETGGKVYYFLLSFYALILLPITFFRWPKSAKPKGTPHPEDTLNYLPCREKYRLLNAKEPNRRLRARIT